MKLNFFKFALFAFSEPLPINLYSYNIKMCYSILNFINKVLRYVKFAKPLGEAATTARYIDTTTRSRVTIIPCDNIIKTFYHLQ